MSMHGQTASAETHISNSCIHVNQIHLFFLSLGRKSGISLRRCLVLVPAHHLSTSDLFPGCAEIKHLLFLTVSLNQTDYYYSLAAEQARRWKHPYSLYSRSLILKSVVQSHGFSNLYIIVKHKPVTVKHTDCMAVL